MSKKHRSSTEHANTDIASSTVFVDYNGGTPMVEMDIEPASVINVEWKSVAVSDANVESSTPTEYDLVEVTAVVKTDEPIFVCDLCGSRMNIAFSYPAEQKASLCGTCFDRIKRKHTRLSHLPK